MQSPWGDPDPLEFCVARPEGTFAVVFIPNLLYAPIAALNFVAGNTVGMVPLLISVKKCARVDLSREQDGTSRQSFEERSHSPYSVR